MRDEGEFVRVSCIPPAIMGSKGYFSKTYADLIILGNLNNGTRVGKQMVCGLPVLPRMSCFCLSDQTRPNGLGAGVKQT